MYNKSLFGLNKDGTFKVWHIEVSQYTCPVDEVERNAISIRHGKEGGALQEKLDFFESGFQGRSAIEQAVFEAKARVKKQLDKNYRETKEELVEIPVLAMLAKDHTKVGKEETINKGVYVSDKLDGVRCLAKCVQKLSGVVVTLESRTGQVYSVPHIEEQLLSVMGVGDILDGELYVHGPSLQEITSAVKRTNAAEKWAKAEAAFNKYAERSDCEQEKCDQLAEKLHDAASIARIRSALEFRVFDVVLMDVPFDERLKELNRFDLTPAPSVVLVEYGYVDNLEDLKLTLKESMELGYEGVMYRTQDGLYESGKRSSGLFKFKLFLDSEFEIVGVSVDKQGYAVFECRNDLNSNTFDCVLGTYEWRLQAASEKELYIGKYLTVQYQARYKDTLLPQFPTGKLIRAGEVVNGKFVPSE